MVTCRKAKNVRGGSKGLKIRTVPIYIFIICIIFLFTNCTGFLEITIKMENNKPVFYLDGTYAIFSVRVLELKDRDNILWKLDYADNQTNFTELIIKKKKAFVRKKKIIYGEDMSCFFKFKIGPFPIKRNIEYCICIDTGSRAGCAFFMINDENKIIIIDMENKGRKSETNRSSGISPTQDVPFRPPYIPPRKK